MAASPDKRESVFKRDRGICQICRSPVTESNAVVAHKNHRRRLGYHKDGNHELRCQFCEGTVHANAIGKSERIVGLSECDNWLAVISQFIRMDQSDQEKFRAMFPDIMKQLE